MTCPALHFCSSVGLKKDRPSTMTSTAMFQGCFDNSDQLVIARVRKLQQKSLHLRISWNGPFILSFTNVASRFTIYRAMNNEKIAARFNRMASLMEVRGEDSFRVRSYRMAAEAIETWPTEMEQIVAEQSVTGLLEIPGVGKA